MAGEGSGQPGSGRRPKGIPEWADHGGSDDGLPIRHDFSTNSNPLPSPLTVMAAVSQADRHRYPDPQYRALAAALGRFHQVGADRVLPGAGSSESIRRLNLAGMLAGVDSFWVPEPGYADYSVSARALGVQVRHWRDGDELIDGLKAAARPAVVWINEPCNPTGASLPELFWWRLLEVAVRYGCWLVVDRAYEPLRLEGEDPIPMDVADHCWQLWSPNKSLGLTGVRAGYVIAPDAPGDDLLAQRLRGLAPSWVLSAEGQALLGAWIEPHTQVWLARARQALRAWRDEQRAQLDELGWEQRPTVTNFWLCKPPLAEAALDGALAQLRARGIKLRDARSLGLPGWVRVSTQAEDARAALTLAWRSLGRSEGSTTP